MLGTHGVPFSAPPAVPAPPAAASCSSTTTATGGSTSGRRATSTSASTPTRAGRPAHERPQPPQFDVSFRRYVSHLHGDGRGGEGHRQARGWQGGVLLLLLRGCRSRNRGPSCLATHPPIPHTPPAAALILLLQTWSACPAAPHPTPPTDPAQPHPTHPLTPPHPALPHPPHPLPTHWPRRCRSRPRGPRRPRLCSWLGWRRRSPVLRHVAAAAGSTARGATWRAERGRGTCGRGRQRGRRQAAGGGTVGSVGYDVV